MLAFGDLLQTVQWFNTDKKHVSVGHGSVTVWLCLAWGLFRQTRRWIWAARRNMEGLPKLGVKSCVTLDMLCNVRMCPYYFPREVVFGVAVIIQFGSKRSLDSSISRHRENLLDMQLNTQLCCHKDQYRTSLPPHLGFHSLTHVFKYFWLTWHSHFPTIGINREPLLFLNTFDPASIHSLEMVLKDEFVVSAVLRVWVHPVGWITVTWWRCTQDKLKF